MTPVKNRYMDIHTHILPNIDDGAENMGQALRMADIAYSEGVSLIVATPHYGIMNPSFDLIRAKETFAELRTRIREKHPDMGMVMGNELYYSGSTIEDLNKGKALTIGGTDYVLLEFSPMETYGLIELALRNLISSGFRPILAHAERYESMRNDVGAVYDLIEMGTAIQINANSLLRNKMDKRGGWTRKLIKTDLVHFIGSDCHSDSIRPPIMHEAITKLTDLADKEQIYKIVIENTAKLAKNKFL